MKDCKLLIKANLIQMLHLDKWHHKTSRAEKLKSLLIPLAILYVIICFVTMTTWYASLLADGLTALGAINLLPLLGIVLVSLVILFFSMYSLLGHLFAAKDYDFLFSLPVKPSTILISKLFASYILNCLLTAAFLIPLLILYYFKAGASPWLFSFIPCTILLIPLLPMLIAVIVAYMISFLASRTKRFNNLITMLFMLISLVAVLALQFQGNKLLPLLLTHYQTIMTELKNFFPPAYFLSDALTSLNIGALLLSTCYIVLPTGIILYLLSKNLKKLVAKHHEHHQKGNFKLSSLKQRTALAALYAKELKRYTTSPMYMMNTGVGMFLVLCLAIYSLFLSDAQLNQLLAIPELQTLLLPMLIALVSGGITLSLTSSVAISLEGKNLWLLQSLPVLPQTIFKAKLLLNLTLTVPIAMLCSVLFILRFHLTLLDGFLLLLIPFLYALLSTCCGLIVNLYFPSLNWSNETVVIKQSLSSLLGVLLSLGMIALPTGIFIIFKVRQQMLFLIIVAISLIALNFFFYTLLFSKGIKRFNKLGEA